MRKLLLVCLTLLLHLTATAQDWTVNNNKYPNKTTVYMKIDGLVIGHSYDVGAFIDGVCRGITTNSVFVIKTAPQAVSEWTYGVRLPTEAKPSLSK